MTPSTEELDQLKRQNALLLRALQRANRERDAMAARLASADGIKQSAVVPPSEEATR